MGSWTQVGRYLRRTQMRILGRSLPAAEPWIRSQLIGTRRPWCRRCGLTADDMGVLPPCCDPQGPDSPVWDQVLRVGAYTPAFASLIAGLKYRRWWELAGPLGHRLGQVARVELGASTAREAIWTAVPMPIWRYWRRGLDHASLVNQAAAQAAGASTACVLRRWWGQTQSGKSRSRRLLATRSGWRVTAGAATEIFGRHVVLVDDVLTTGQTLRLACRMLLELGALRVTVAVLAVVEPAGRLAQASGHWGDHEKSG